MSDLRSSAPPFRVGPDAFLTDAGRLSQALDGYASGKGLIGGNPALRPRWLHPLPDEPAPAFRLLESSDEHLTRLQSFLQDGPLEIEIGSGRGEFILGWAAQHPARHFLAFEVKWKSLRRIVERAMRRGIINLWASDDDARYDLPRLVQASTVDVIHILFPDPWWKPKHQARRLFVPPFVDELARVLKPGGVLRLATDVPGYAAMIEETIANNGQFSPDRPELAQNFSSAPATARQQFCDEIGRPYQFFYFSKRA